MTLNEPRMGLLLGVRPPHPLVALCRELARWISIGDARDGQRYDVILWRPGDPAGPNAHPYIMFAEDEHAVDKYGRDARLVIATRPELVGRALQAGYHARMVPAQSYGGMNAVPVAPFVRARIRAARGLNEHAVAEHADHWLWQGQLIADIDELLDTMVGLASVVITVVPAYAVRALAWAAPLVTSPDTARLIGATDLIDCVVAADQQSRRERASKIAGDTRLAARISWHSRMLYERRHSLRACSEAVLGVIGMRGTWRPSSLTSLLGELGTRPSAHVVRRVEAFVDPVVRPLPEWTESRRDPA
jgi:hypothetical protein